MRVAVTGASGRMGLCLLKAVIQSPKLALTAAVARHGSSIIGKDAGVLASMEATGVIVAADLAAVTDQFDLLIDFTRADITQDYLKICHQYGKKMVIGTTGHTLQQQQYIGEASADIAVVLAPNMSVGVNLALKLLEISAKVIGKTSDIEIIEAHHSHKIDAPSGTSLKMGEVIADTLGYDLQKSAIYGRQGNIGKRSRDTIGFATIRGGDIVGDHTVLFAGEGERLEISHKANNRMNFAVGATLAANWLEDKTSGLYDMRDVLGLDAIT